MGILLLSGRCYPRGGRANDTGRRHEKRPLPGRRYEKRFSGGKRRTCPRRAGRADPGTRRPIVIGVWRPPRSMPASATATARWSSTSPTTAIRPGWCPPGVSDGCDCRKPQPGLLIEASRRLGVDLGSCGLIGDTAADVDAALAVGARPVLVPNERTLPREVERAPAVARTFGAAARRLVEGR